MTIGIDISQTAYEKTGVSNLLMRLVEELVRIDKKNTYVLFFSSLRRPLPEAMQHVVKNNPHVRLKELKLPPKVLDLLWNKLHQIPVETFVGDVDLFISSDWTEPPTLKAKKATILYDLIVYTAPQETDEQIIAVQKRRLNWVKKESDKIICISEATKKDARQILGIEENRLDVVYPGVGI